MRMTVVRVYIPSRVAALAAAADRQGAPACLAQAAAERLLPLITAQYAAAGHPDDDAVTGARRALLAAATRARVPEARGAYRPRRARAQP